MAKNSFVVKVTFKGCVHYIFPSLFVCLKESTFETRKNIFIPLRKLFSFLR